MAKNILTSTSYLRKLFGVAHQTAIVTGASSGIGREMASALGQAGERVILVSRRPKLLADTVKSFSSLGVETYSLQADLADHVALKQLVATILSTYGIPDILVNAASIDLRPPMDKLTGHNWDATNAANLTAP